jgi:hypothetical protein
VNTPNAWHHLERVYLQARFEKQVLVQYVEREMVPRKRMPDNEWDGPTVIRQPVHQWAWVAGDDVLPFTEFDDAMMAVWKIA